MALPSRGLHASTLLASRVLLIFLLKAQSRLALWEQATVALFGRTRLLYQLIAVGEEVRGGRGHANGIQVGEVIARCLWVLTGAGFLGRGGWFNDRCGRCDLAETFDGATVGTTASSAGGGGGGLGDSDEGAVDVAQGTGFHALAAFGATAGNDGSVDRVRGFVDPSSFSFAAREREMVSGWW